MEPLLISNDSLPGGEPKNAHLHQLFPSPVYECDWPDMEPINKELRALIDEKRNSSRGTRKTNRGGWQSPYELQNWDAPCVKELMGRILLFVRSLTDIIVPNASDEHHQGWEIEAWANINPPGAYNAPHMHNGAKTVWSGVYYVDIGSPQDGRPIRGETVFEDRQKIPIEKISDGNVFRREFVMTPKNGKMLLFPGRAYHRVSPYEGVGNRYTIAFNLGHGGFTLPLYPGMGDPNWRWKYFQGPMIALKFVEGKLRKVIK